MSESHAPIPGPTPFDEAAGQRELPEELKPAEPAPYHVTQLSREGRDELGIVFKRTYGFQDGHVPWPDEEQPPLDPEGTPHDPLDPGGPPSYRSLPEVVAFKTGTDLVVQGCARPPRPTTRMQVGVRIGNVEHRADVLGPRRAEYVNGSLAFTPPEEFEAMPLRYENAYGGRDEPFEERLASEVEETTPAEDLRRARPSFEATFAEGHPLAYPRNRFGKGYVIEDRRELIEGRELPNLERPDDRLTPERLVVGHPMD
ncbi:MAG TPA: DUF2169 domain-containing protein, partial [Longimicrobiales bacterium]|nr:DUF2169 domain-containing protein [Longimicrobiales bacterium]